jgi:hypothetical protein
VRPARRVKWLESTGAACLDVISHIVDHFLNSDFGFVVVEHGNHQFSIVLKYGLETSARTDYERKTPDYAPPTGGTGKARAELGADLAGEENGAALKSPADVEPDLDGLLVAGVDFVEAGSGGLARARAAVSRAELRKKKNKDQNLKDLSVYH